MPRHWLMKSEAECYPIEALERDGTTCWDGVRNHQARNFMRDDMKVGDLVLFHHSNGDPSGIAGVARVARAAYPDHTAWTRGHDHFDPRATEAEPIWMMVDLAFVERFPALVSLEDLRAEPGLASLPVLQRGQRLSVMPVDAEHFALVRRMGRAGGAAAESKTKSTSGARSGRGAR